MSNQELYKRLNFTSIIAMVMVDSIHFFSHFSMYIDIDILRWLSYVIRSASIIAVPLYLIIMGYSNIILKKEVNYKKLLFFIIIPTFLFGIISHLLFGKPLVSYNLQVGFTASWFGDLYLGLMLTLPFVLYMIKKNKNLTIAAFILLYIGGYIYSIVAKTPNLNNLGIWVFVPYIGQVFIITYLTFKTKPISPKITLSIMGVIIMWNSLFYTPTVIQTGMNLQIFRSYFAPLVILYAILFLKTILTLNVGFKSTRELSQTSYFFYFTHYIVINFYLIYIPKLVESYTVPFYIINIFLALGLSYVLFKVYQQILKVLQIF